MYTGTLWNKESVLQGIYSFYCIIMVLCIQKHTCSLMAYYNYLFGVLVY